MLETSEIKRLIDNDITSEKKRLAAVGVRYYEADHDIRDYRLFYFNKDNELVEDTFRSNIKISHPFFTELADQLVAYILSDTDEIIKTDAEGLQEHLNQYFDEEFWAEMSELLTGAYTKGFDYVYAYQKKDGDRLAFEYADSMGVIEVRANDTDDGCEYIIYWYIDRIEKGKKEIKRIQVHSESETTFYVQSGTNGKITLDDDKVNNPMPNVVFEKDGKKYGGSLGFVPYFRLDYNRKQFSGLKPIKGLIDDYDLHACSLSNNLKDFDTPIHVVKGFRGSNLDELQMNLKTKKVVGTDADGGIEVQTVNIPYQARKEKLEIDEKSIYKFGMGTNTQALKDTSATTNLAIQTAYSLLDLKAGKFITRIKAFLKQLLNPVIDEINRKNKTGYTVDDVYFNFNPKTLVNESEDIANEKIKAETKQIEINTLLSIAVYIGDDELLKALCDTLEFDYAEIKAAVEKAKAEEVPIDEAKGKLNGITTDPIDIEKEGVEL